MGVFEKPVRWSAPKRKSPERSPVKKRPVRLAPCAAGARPKTTKCASGSPKPGTGRPQYSSPVKAALFSRATFSRQATSRGQRRQETTSRCSSLSVLQLNARAESQRALSCSVAVKLEGVAHEVAHDLLPGEHPERPARAGALPEALSRRQGVGGVEQERNPVPGVALEPGWGCVVAGYGERGGAGIHKNRYLGVYLLDDPALTPEVAVFPGGVRRLYVDEEEVVGIPILS